MQPVFPNFIQTSRLHIVHIFAGAVYVRNGSEVYFNGEINVTNNTARDFGGTEKNNRSTPLSAMQCSAVMNDLTFSNFLLAVV